ncbi:MAG: hypothetical protein IPM35_40630 [Myxococcales bacterium]|nr:hypothetical protein [Myxococcales bacterium]
MSKSWLFRVGSLSLALGFLGFSMLRAGTGCTKSDAPITPEAPPQNPAAAPAAPAEPAAAPAASEAPAAAPSAEPAATPAAKPAGPPPGYFPGTKAAPMHFDPPPQQQAAPKQ